MQTKLIVLALVPLLLVTACGGGENEPTDSFKAPHLSHDLETQEGTTGAMKDIMSEMAETMEGIKTKDDFESAKPKLKTLAESMGVVQKSLAKLKEPKFDTPEEGIAAMEKFKKDKEDLGALMERAGNEKARLEKLDFWKEMDEWMEATFKEAGAKM